MNNNLLLEMGPYFTRKLLEWNAKDNRREMPWKGEKDPYKIWLSEIILQQTRVEQGWSYYLKFIEHFPSVVDLAKAPEEKVFKLWEGLGYYSRCRNLIASARIIHNEHNNIFPRTYEDVLALKGVGGYTAAAIVSFAYNQPYAVVDGNVLRVLARYFGIRTAIDSTEGKKLFASLAQELLPQQQAGIYNQALMDFGATVCKPQSPTCASCPVSKKCIAYEKNQVDLLPVKEKKLKRTQRWFYYVVLRYKDETFITQRTKKDIWQSLYEFPMIEIPELELNEKELTTHPAFATYLKNGDITGISKPYVQHLTHQTIHGRFIEIQLRKRPAFPDAFISLSLKNLKAFAFPKLINNYLMEKNVNLS